MSVDVDGRPSLRSTRTIRSAGTIGIPVEIGRISSLAGQIKFPVALDRKLRDGEVARFYLICLSIVVMFDSSGGCSSHIAVDYAMMCGVVSAPLGGNSRKKTALMTANEIDVFTLSVRSFR